MRTFIVTGASSGIGRAIAEKLAAGGDKVYGIGRNFEDETSDGFEIIKIREDLTREGAFDRIYRQIPEKKIDGLIIAAGVAFYGTHENISKENISEMVDVNVKAPLVLTNMFLPKIRAACGIIVNISSVTAKSNANTHGAAYGATKAALTSFGQSLFEEIRKQNVRVTTIHPDLAATNLYRNADFNVSDKENEALSASDVAAAVMDVINARDGLCVTDVTIRPQHNKIVKKN